MKSLTMLKGIVPCESTVIGASTSITLTTTAPSPITNALEIHASFQSGTQWSAITAQLPLKMTCMSSGALRSTTKMRSCVTSCVVATGIGGAWCYDLVLPPFCFLFPSPLFSHMTLCHKVRHLTCHLTLSHDCLLFWLVIVHNPLSTLLGDTYCSTLIVPLSPLFCPYCLGPYSSLGPIVHPFWMLSQVAASVVYKPCLYRRRGLKPDLVYQSKCCCSHQTCVLLSSSISSLFGSSQDPLRLSLQTLSSLQDVCLGIPLQSTTIITKGVSPLWLSALPDPPCMLHLKAIRP